MATSISLRNVNVRASVRLMPDPTSTVLENCIQLAKTIQAKCPSAASDCDELLLWLETLNRREGLRHQQYRVFQDFSTFRVINDAVVEYLDKNSLTHATAGEIIEALVAGNMGKVKLGGRTAFWRALNTKNREDLEVERGDPEDRDSWIIRRRPSKRPNGTAA